MQLHTPHLNYSFVVGYFCSSLALSWMTRYCLTTWMHIICTSSSPTLSHSSKCNVTNRHSLHVDGHNKLWSLELGLLLLLKAIPLNLAIRFHSIPFRRNSTNWRANTRIAGDFHPSCWALPAAGQYRQILAYTTHPHESELLNLSLLAYLGAQHRTSIEALSAPAALLHFHLSATRSLLHVPMSSNLWALLNRIHSSTFTHT